jgi:UDP:flavonoid glycosyltransferase YjiC (YdhE family)
MQRKALLCWEAGSGSGHAVALLDIGRRLQASGWRPILALPNDRIPPNFDPDGMMLCAAPRWGDGAAALNRTTRSSASLGDSLAQIGLQSAEWVRRQIDRWHRLFTEYLPDLIVADYAPGAVLAARGRVPCVACGVGFTVPPANMRQFPLLHDSASALYDEAAICATVNSALAESGTPPIAFLAEALTGDVQCVCTLPLLDPYDAFRSEPVLGPRLDAPIVRRDPDADEIFCYLREAPQSSRLDEFAACLCDLPGRVVAYLPGLSEASAARLSRYGIKVLDGPAPLAAQLSRSRLAIHFGGHGVAAAALLAGVPQVILSFDIEKLLIATALVQRGVAQRFDYYQASMESVIAAALTALANPAQAAEADRAAREQDRYRSRDLGSEIAATCLRLAA